MSEQDAHIIAVFSSFKLFITAKQILFRDTVIRIQEGKNKHTALFSWSDSASLMVFYKGSKTYYA